MNKFVRQAVSAAGLVALGLASSASWAATATWEFKTFFDTSTASATDTKTLGYSIATLTAKDITGGVEFVLTQNNNAFPAKLGGTFVDALWLKGPNGSLKLDSTDTPLSLLGLTSGYSKNGFKEEGYSFNWDIDFLDGGFSEGESAKFRITGTGVTLAAFGSTPMLDIDNVAKPYTSGFLGLNDNVHFIGTLVPEPSTYAMLGLGLVGITCVARRRRAA